MEPLPTPTVRGQIVVCNETQVDDLSGAAQNVLAAGAPDPIMYFSNLFSMEVSLACSLAGHFLLPVAFVDTCRGNSLVPSTLAQRIVESISGTVLLWALQSTGDKGKQLVQLL
jgi:hypothetical protein